jgi:hypothetical protein
MFEELRIWEMLMETVTGDFDGINGVEVVLKTALVAVGDFGINGRDRLTSAANVSLAARRF